MQRIVLLLALLGSTTACSVETASTKEEATASVKDMQVSKDGFTATVIRGDAKVMIDLERAVREHMELIANPDEVERFVSNFRVHNRHDYPFIIVGDDMLAVNPETGQVDISPPGQVDQQEQLEDLSLVLDAIEMLSKRPVGERFRSDLKVLGRSAHAALENANAIYDGRLDGGQVKEGVVQKALDGVAVTTQALGGTTYTQNFFIKYRPGWWVYGDHSSVKIDVYYSSGSYIGYLSTRNHGLEADDPSMSSAYLCPRAFYNRPTTLPPVQPWASTDTALTGDAGGCNSSYGLLSGQHVCNDDSLVMRDIAVSNSVTYNHSTCYDSSVRAFAPSCY